MTVRRMEEAIADRSLPIRLTYADGHVSLAAVSSLLSHQPTPIQNNIVLKTEWRNEISFVRFCNEFIAVPSPTSQDTGVYTIALSLLPLVNPWNVNLNQGLIAFMSDTLGCQFLYPPKEKFDDQAPYYFIRGESVVRVLQAARFLFVSASVACLWVPVNHHHNISGPDDVPDQLQRAALFPASGRAHD